VPPSIRAAASPTVDGAEEVVIVGTPLIDVSQ